MANNSGIIRQLKKNKNETAQNNNAVKKFDASLLISSVALLISILAIYFQFFYEKFDLSTSVIDHTIENDTISLSIIYHNKGNQDATIIGSEIFFYSDKNKKNTDNYIQFINNNIQNPYILPPGKQLFEKYIQPVYFNEDSLLIKNKTTNKDTLRMLLRVSYLNSNSLQSEKVVECGWITLDSLNKIDYWKIKYQKINLDSDEFFVGASRPKK